MTLKRSILILLCSLTLTALKGQEALLCDSSISVCPRTFTYLITQDIKEQQCREKGYILQAMINEYQFQLKQADSLQKATSDILSITNQEKDLLNTTIEIQDKLMGKQARQITGLKIGCFAIGVVGIITTTYFIIK